MAQRPVPGVQRSAAAEKQKTCFVIAPIGPDGSETRKQSDQVLKHIIKKALEPRYIVERADDINRSGTIIAQIVQRVFEADLVVADLSGRNANVFYELAIRHDTRRPAVHLAAVTEDVPFDVNQIRLIKYNLSDPDSIEDAQKRLSDQVDAIERGEQVITPVQFAKIIESLESGDTKDQQLLEVLKGLSQGIESVKVDVSNIQAKLSPGTAYVSPGTPYLTAEGAYGLIPNVASARVIYNPASGEHVWWENPPVFPSSPRRTTEAKAPTASRASESGAQVASAGKSAPGAEDTDEKGK